MLDSAEGSIQVVAAEDWTTQRLHVAFDAHLKSGPGTYLSFLSGTDPVGRLWRSVKIALLLRDKLNFELFEFERDILRQPIFNAATARGDTGDGHALHRYHYILESDMTS